MVARQGDTQNKYFSVMLMRSNHLPTDERHRLAQRNSILTTSKPFSCRQLVWILSITILIISTYGQQTIQAQRFIDSSTLKPSIYIIVPQAFRVPISADSLDERVKLQQYVAIINNAQSDREDQLLRQQYKKLSLQVRDAKSPITGQLFYEHIFDYFPPNQQHLLIPLNLDQVSTVQERIAPSAAATPSARSRYSSSSAFDFEQTEPPPTTVQPQQLIISIRPYQLDLGFGSENIEFVSSSPVLVEPVPSKDGRRSFSFVQTDKPVYKPNERVRIRGLVVNELLRPIARDEVRLQIKNPHKVVVEEVRFPRPNQRLVVTTDNNNRNLTKDAKKQEIMNNNSIEPQFYFDHNFEFPTEPMLGIWSVHLLHNDPIANDTINFEVKEYTLPPFEIEFNIQQQYILPSTQKIAGHIVAKYHYGKPVQGKAQFKFGLRESLSSRPRYIARSMIKTVDPNTGRVDFKLETKKIQETDWFPSLAGWRFVVEVTITEMTTGHRETVQDSSCVFITMPFRISFENSIEDFKPGLNQSLAVQLIDAQTQQPGPAGERIFAQYRDQNGTLLTANQQKTNSDFQEILDTEAVTDSLGRAFFTIGLLRDDITMIQVSMRSMMNSTSSGTNKLSHQQHQLEDKASNEIVTSKSDLAVGHHTLVRHESQNGWISFANKSVTFLNIGNEFVSDLLIRDAIVLPQKIFYLIVARGQIISLNTLDKDGFVRFRISEDMMPSIRVVLFAFTSDSVGLLSDSIRINIGHNLNCGLKLRFKPTESNHHDDRASTATFRPNTKGTLEIAARQGDVISLVGVDSAVYSLNNRSRLESTRVVQRIKKLDAGCGFGGGRDMVDVFHNAGLMIFKEIASTATHIGSSCLTVINQLRYLEDAQLGYTKPIFTHLLSRPRALEVAMKMQRYKYGFQLAGHSRAKREVHIEGILRRYRDPKHRACCRLGTMEDLPQRRDCGARAKIVEKYMRQDVEHTALKSCSQIYLDCCRAVFGDPLSMGSIVGRSGLESPIDSRRVTNLQQSPQENQPVLLPNIGQLDQIEAETLVRKDFRETWLFDLVEIDSSSSSNGSASVPVTLPHSITSWTISAMALNQDKPMCLMARPMKLITFQQIFLQVSMPYKVVQGEQIDLVTSIFNYSPQVQEVLVYMFGVDDVCSEAEPGERSEHKRARVEKHSSQAVLFPMIPLRTGKYSIKIVAVSLKTNHSDIVERELNVVPRGKPVTDETTFSLDPMNHQRRSKRAIQTGNLVDEIDSARGLQHSKVRLTPTRDSEFIVPQTQECIISAIGDKMGQTVQTTMLDVENLIRLPHGCGEQVMIYLGPTLYTTRYLSSMNKLSGDLRWRAIRYIQSGYKRILNFRKETTGAFSAFARRDPSIWLTAFVSKMLCQTEQTKFISEEIHVDRSVVNSALTWLIESQNKDTGTWLELNPVYHREMLGGVLRENALTAFVVVTLNECAHHWPDLVDETRTTTPTGATSDSGGDKSEPQQSFSSSSSSGEPHAQSNGVDKLKLATLKAEEALMLDRFKALKEKNPYVLALTAYALSFSRPREAVLTLTDLMSIAERSQSRNQLFWRGEYPIETAAYALQAMIELAPIIASPSSTFQVNWSSGADAIAIANWLSSRRSYTGAFESTQDTIVALEALSKFALLQSTPDGIALVSQNGNNNNSPNLSCNVTVNNRTRRSIDFGKDNAQVLQTFKLDSFDLDLVNGEMIDILTSGNGLGTMSVKLKYNVFQEEDELCRFNIDSSVEEWQPKIVASPPKSSEQQGSSQEDSIDEITEGKQAPSDEDDLFKTFDKSMLNELNLIDINQHIDGTGQQQQQRPRNQSSSITILRFRRATTNETTTSENWASKMVSSLRSRLPAWMSSKHLSSSESTSTTQSPRLAISSLVPSTTIQSITNHQVDSARDPSQRSRGGTLRRSTTQQSLVPMISTPSGIPASAHMNNLSKQFDFGSSTNQTNLNSSLSINNVTHVNSLSTDSIHRLVLLLRVCVHHMSSRRDSEMAVIEIGILSGFKPNEADLNEIIHDVGTPAMKYELSQDKSLVIIYMHYIPFTGPFCLQFRLIRDSFVYNIQSGYIRVYEYYSPTHSCSNFYTPNRVSDLIETNCDSSGQVCQCATRSLCPANRKILELGEIQRVNATSARGQLVDLICSSNRFDLVSLVKLKSVRHLEAGKMFKLTVKIKMDIKGNLTKIIEAQRQQKAQLFNTIRRPQHNQPSLSSDIIAASSSSPNEQLLAETMSATNGEQESSSLDYLSLNIDSNCVRNDPLLLHLAHPSQWRQGGETMILFARTDKLEKRQFRVAPKASSHHSPVGPRPKAAIIFSNQQQAADQSLLPSSPSTLNFQDGQQLQYSLTLPLDKNSILHDISYQAKVGSRESINNLMFWLELRSRREKWSCGTK